MRRAEHHYGLLPLSQRRAWERLDVLPFAIGYLCLIVIDHRQHNHAPAAGGGRDGHGGGWWTNYLADALLPLAMLLHAMLRLACVWNVKIRAKVGFRSCHQRDAGWTHVLVEPPPNSGGGGPDLVEVSRSGSESIGRGGGERSEVVTVDFRQTRFRCCLGASGADEEMDGIWTAMPGSGPVGDATAAAAGETFHTLHFPIDLPLTFYAQWSGHGTAESLSRVANLYGKNSHPIPIPPISALLSHQLLQPFFLFQLLCVMLWSLDEYWYYAIFTLLMLILFEWRSIV
jgi:cation-transporting ATPase 13A1